MLTLGQCLQIFSDLVFSLGLLDLNMYCKVVKFFEIALRVSK